MRNFVVVGVGSVMAGGLTAAASRPTGFGHGSWLAAYLVLVGGVAQIALGAGQAVLAAQPPSTNRVMVELAAWNAGLLGVVLGTLGPAVAVTMAGGLATSGALVSFLGGVRRSGVVVPVRVLHLYRTLAAFVLVSTPVGLAMAWSRRG
jgi:hypothetical protein